MSKPRIQVEQIPTFKAPPPSPVPSQTASKSPTRNMDKTKSGLSPLNQTKPMLLGSDLAPPLKSEFKLKHDIDPKDRGRPMIDWIRRQSSQDSGNYSDDPRKKVHEVTKEELKMHSLPIDAWMALRGQVYDVTEYISFHPGGVREIMKGVGKDGTALFNSIHRYVNFESILKGNQVGVYAPNRRPSLSAPQGADLVVTNLHSSANKPGERKLTCFNKLVRFYKGGYLTCFGIPPKEEYEDEMIPSTKFSEDRNFCFYTVNLKNFKFTEDYWTASIIQKNTLLLKVVTTPPEMWVAYYKLRETLLNDSIGITFTNRFRTMTLKIEKPRDLPWKSIGEAYPDSNLILDSRYSIDDRNPCCLVMKELIARDMYLLAIEVNPSARIGVPVGFDVKITAVKQGVSRRYTPIPLLFQKKTYKYVTKNEVLYFIVKVYPDGKMTQILKGMPLNENGRMEIGYSCGNFNTDWLHGANTYFLFAAGSGITPFFGILNYYLEHNIALGISHVVLVHWSKEEADLVWHEDFKTLEKEKAWFNFVPVLTQVAPDDESWKGLGGRISLGQLSTILDIVPSSKTKKSKVRFMTCGPEGFNCSVCEIIERSDFPLTSTFVFLG